MIKTTKRLEGGSGNGAWTAEVEVSGNGYDAIVEFLSNARAYAPVVLARIERRARGGYSVEVVDGVSSGVRFERKSTIVEALRAVVTASNYAFNLSKSNPF